VYLHKRYYYFPPPCCLFRDRVNSYIICCIYIYIYSVLKTRVIFAKYVSVSLIVCMFFSCVQLVRLKMYINNK